MFCLCLVLTALAAWALHWFLVSPYNYWKNKGVPCPSPTVFVGNVGSSLIMKKNLGQIFSEIYKDFQNLLYVGVYSIRRPVLLVRDPDLLKEILVKNFNNFHDNDVDVDEKIDPITARNPFILKGHKWRVVRGYVTSAITSAKIKNMYIFMNKVGEDMVRYLETEVPKNTKHGLEAKELAAKYTTDVVASCAFGLEGKCFEDPNAEFRRMGKKFLTPSFWMGIKFTIIFVLPTLGKLLKIRWISEELHNWFCGTLMETIKYRERNGIVRNDYLDMMISLKTKSTNYEFQDIDVIAQAMTFYADGFETSSTVISYALYELAANKHIQDKLRDELDTVFNKHNREITYEALQDMNYLDMVFSEALRKYPPGMFLRKLCTKSTTFPPPGGNGNGPLVSIEVGTPIIVPLYALHHDPKYFPEPEKFDPERFTEEAKQSRPNNVYMPFGDGPRQCLGYRFALAQSKIAIIWIILNYELSVNSKTIEPLQIDPQSFIIAPAGGLWLNFKKKEKIL